MIQQWLICALQTTSNESLPTQTPKDLNPDSCLWETMLLNVVLQLCSKGKTSLKLPFRKQRHGTTFILYTVYLITRYSIISL